MEHSAESIISSQLSWGGYDDNFSFSYWLHICLDHHQPGLTVRQDLEAVMRLPWTSQLRLLAAFPLTR